MAKTCRGNLPISEKLGSVQRRGRDGLYDIGRVARSVPAVLLSKAQHPSPLGSHHALAPRHTG